MTFKPMRAAGPDPKRGEKHFWENLRYPLLCSTKIDGIRGCSQEALVTSRSGEPLPSLQVQDELGRLHWVDCEITEGNPTDFGVYNRTQSHVMAVSKPGLLNYHVFDYIHPDWLERPFYERLEKAKKVVEEAQEWQMEASWPQCPYRHVEHVEVENYDELLAFEDKMLEEGWEGIIGRDPVGPYKQGASTYNQGWMYKFKRFSDTEGRIIGFVEQMTNTNEQERSALGYAKRSTAKDGMVPANTLGKFVVDWNNQELHVGCGTFTHKERKDVWNHKDLHLGRLLKFRYFAHGVKDLPRHPRALGFRPEMDL